MKRYLPGLLGLFVILASPRAVLASEPMSYFPSLTSGFGNLDRSAYDYQVSKAEGYGESFNLKAYAADGSVVRALISISNYNPFNKGMGAIDLHWVAGDQVYVVHQEFDADEIQFGTPKGTQFGRSSTLNVTAEGAEIYYQGKDTEGQKVELSLTLKPTEAGAQAGDSNLYFGNDPSDYWGLKLLAPRGEVTAVLKTADGVSHTLHLTGYLDHGRATIKVPDFTDHWYRLHFFTEKWTLDLLEITPERKYGQRQPQLLYLAKNHQPLGLFAEWTYPEDGFSKHKQSRYELPTGWTLNLDRDDLKINGTVKVQREVMAVDVLGSVSWALRMILKTFVANPWQHYLLVDVDLTIEHEGITERVQGLGLATAEYY